MANPIKMPEKIYFISGLGADKRIFSFLDLSFCEPIYIDWIAPLQKESLQDYALRLRKQIKEESPIIIGISFGGMLVTEMAKADLTMKGIIISSNKTRTEFPGRWKFAKYFPVYQWLPDSFLKRIMLSSKWILGAKRKEQKALLHKIISDADIPFTRWAIHSILNWKNEEIPDNLIHIHGTADRLLPYSRVKATYTIEKGTHVLPMDQHIELSTLLRQLI